MKKIILVIMMLLTISCSVNVNTITKTEKARIVNRVVVVGENELVCVIIIKLKDNTTHLFESYRFYYSRVDEIMVKYSETIEKKVFPETITKQIKILEVKEINF